MSGSKSSLVKSFSGSRDPSVRLPTLARAGNPIEWFGLLKHRYPDWYVRSSRSEVYPKPWPAEFNPQKNPVFAHNEIFVCSSSPRKIFEILIRAEDWPKFYDNSADVQIQASEGATSILGLKLGSKFQWKTFSMRQTSEVTLYEQDRALGWTAESLGTHAYHRWLLVPEGGGTRVITEECQNGLVAWLDRSLMNPSLHATHQLWLDRLKQVALGDVPQGLPTASHQSGLE